jgi:hypothetical protein
MLHRCTWDLKRRLDFRRQRPHKAHALLLIENDIRDSAEAKFPAPAVDQSTHHGIAVEEARTPLGQSLVIENVTGASGTVGVGRAVRAAPDGYTVSVGNWPTHVVNGAMFALP